MTAKDLISISKKHSFRTVCVLTAILLIGFYFYRKSELPQSKDLLDQKTSEARRLKSNVTNAAQLKEHLSSLEAANAKIVSRLIKVDDLAANQKYFYKLESITGVKLIELRPGISQLQSQGRPVTSKLLYPPAPYNCSVQGTYSQLLDFVRKLENGDHLAKIASANLSLSGGSSDDGLSVSDPLLSLVLTVEFLGQP